MSMARDVDQAPAEFALHTTSWAVGTTETSLLHAGMRLYVPLAMQFPL
jgi:hypothetical protein